MTHLTEEQLCHIAEVTEETQPYNSQEMKQMEHLKVCEECYNKFCTALILAETTSESGYILLSEVYDAKNKVSLNEKAIAVINVIRKKIGESLSVAIEQIEQAKSLFQFEAPLTFGTRGIGEKTSKISKVEDIDDEKTFIMFDSEKNELMVQINVKNIQKKDIRVYAEFKNSDKIEINLVKKGNIVKGTLANIPEVGFQIYIENL